MSGFQRGSLSATLEPMTAAAFRTVETRCGRVRARAFVDRFMEGVEDGDADEILKMLRESRGATMTARMQDPKDKTRWVYTEVPDWPTRLTAGRLFLAVMGLPSKEVNGELPDLPSRMSTEDKLRELEAIGVGFLSVFEAMQRSASERRALAVPVETTEAQSVQPSSPAQ